MQIEVPDELLVDGKIDGKFKDVAAMVKALKDAQVKITEQGQEIGKLVTKIDVAPPGGPTETVGKNATTAVKLNALLARLQHGDATVLPEMQELGIDTNLVVQQIELAQDSLKRYMGQLHDVAGGEDAFKEQLRWATESGQLTRHELQSLQREMGSGDPTRQMNAARSLRERYRDSEGYEARDYVVTVPGGASKKIAAFKNEDEMAVAFSDPRAMPADPKFDRAYRAEIEARAGVTDLEGVGRNEPSTIGVRPG